jgi:hypothetical protein
MRSEVLDAEVHVGVEVGLKSLSFKDSSSCS